MPATPLEHWLFICLAPVFPASQDDLLQLTTRFVRVVVLALEFWRAESWSVGAQEFCALSELHPAYALEVLNVTWLLHGRI